MNLSRQLIPSLAGLTLSLTLAAGLASPAMATEVILVAAASTSAVPGAQPEQSLDAIRVSGGYDAGTRRALLGTARYPNNPDARHQRLAGKVAVTFEIDRQGALIHADVVQSSQQKLLDKAALASVRWARYAEFPAQMQPGEQSRRYTATFDFRPAPLD